MVLSVSAVLFNCRAQAQAERHFYTGVRQLGMGGAYVDTVNDESAILLNPAALGRLRETTLVAIDPEVSGSTNDTKVVKLSEVPQLLNPQDILNALNSANHYGTPYFAKAQIFPSFVTTNFGLGLNIKYQMFQEIQPGGTKYNLYYVKDYAPAMAYNMRLYGGIIKMGVSARLVDRTEIDEQSIAVPSTVSVTGNGAEGLGLGIDFGLILTAPIDYLPGIAIVSHDLGTTSFDLSHGMFSRTNSRPEAVGRNTDAGVSISPILGKGVRSTFTAEVQNIEGFKTESDFLRHFHAGGELNFYDFAFLRLGLNQRYWTAGAEFATEDIQIQVATYGEDVGVSPAHQEDRRFVAKVVFRL
jgi:hypothetical protein